MQSPHACRRLASTVATLLVVAAFVIAVPGLRAAQASDTQHAAAIALVPPALFPVAPTSVESWRFPPRTVEARGGVSSFGYLEFDWHDGVPGFAPLPNDPTDPAR